MVVCHDLNLKRVAGVDRRLGTMTYDQVSRLDVGSHFSPRFAGERIPTLEEVLEACKGRMKLNIELKNIGNSSSLPEQVAAWYGNTVWRTSVSSRRLSWDIWSG